MRAITRPLPSTMHGSAIDLTDFAGSDGYLFVRDSAGLAGRGVAARADEHEVTSLLASITHDDQMGGIHVSAIGTIAFEPNAAPRGAFIIPRVTLGTDSDGRQWVTVVGDDHESLDLPDLAPASPPTPRSQDFTVEPLTPVHRYLRAVESARDAVRNGALTKAVIAREITVRSSEPIDVHAVLRRLRATFGRSYRYSIDGFIGASPELLIAVHGNDVQSHPLAGTTPRTGDPDTDRRAADELLASEKNQIEHRVVIDMIHDTLLPWCSYLDWEPEPSIVTVANVQHLGTMMAGHLSDPRPHVLELVDALCPTPALGGFPRTDALELIAAHEGFERGRYGGAVGWLNAAGDGVFAVAIRCAELSDDRRSARLIAGGGIVAESEPSAELAETQAKFQAMLSAIIRP